LRGPFLGTPKISKYIIHVAAALAQVSNVGDFATRVDAGVIRARRGRKQNLGLGEAKSLEFPSEVVYSVHEHPLWRFTSREMSVPHVDKIRRFRRFSLRSKILCRDFNGLYDSCKNRLSTPFAASRILAVISLAGTLVRTGGQGRETASGPAAQR
jgi:hypothetical protein